MIIQMNYGIDIFDLLERLLKILGWESLLQDIESGLGFMNSLKTAFSTLLIRRILYSIPGAV
jgi:hypothetical protein